MSVLQRLILRDLFVNVLGASLLMPRHLRWLLLRLYGAKIGRSSVGPRCFFGGPRITIGSGAFINVGVFFDGSHTITVGDKVHIGMEALILTSAHDVGPESRRAGEQAPAPAPPLCGFPGPRHEHWSGSALPSRCGPCPRP